MKQKFNTVVLINVQDFDHNGEPRTALEELHTRYDMAREIVHELVLEKGITNDAIQIYSIFDYVEMYNNEEISADNTFIGFTNVDEEY